MFDPAPTRLKPDGCLPHNDPCPFHEPGDDICRASLTALVVDARRRHAFCSGDDHDRCERFLARALRSSRAQCCTELWRFELK